VVAHQNTALQNNLLPRISCLTIKLVWLILKNYLAILSFSPLWLMEPEILLVITSKSAWNIVWHMWPVYLAKMLDRALVIFITLSTWNPWIACWPFITQTKMGTAISFVGMTSFCHLGYKNFGPDYSVEVVKSQRYWVDLMDYANLFF